MKDQYLCYKLYAQTVPYALTIERSACNVVIHADNGATFKFLNPSYSHSIRPRGYKTQFILRLKIKRNDWLQAANYCALFRV